MPSNVSGQPMMVSQFVGAAPFLVVALVGAVMCMVRESRPLRVRIAVGVALALYFFLRLTAPLAFSHMLASGNTPAKSLYYWGIEFLPLLSALALGLLLYAAFARDNQVSVSSVEKEVADGVN